MTIASANARRHVRQPDRTAIAPVVLLDWELTGSTTSIRLDASCAALRILVRLDGRPIGWLRIARPGTEVSAARLSHELDAQLGTHVLRSAWRQRLYAAAPIAFEQPPVSVVVCTRDRTPSLATCLQSLLAVDYAQFEIIVVDNAPTSEATAQLVDNYVQQHLRDDTRAVPRLRYARELRGGLDWARNCGLREARHALVAFTDDAFASIPAGCAVSRVDSPIPTCRS